MLGVRCQGGVSGAGGSARGVLVGGCAVRVYLVVDVALV